MSLPTQNPPVPTDYEDLPANWLNESDPQVIPVSGSLNIPTVGGLASPPVHGRGIVRVRSYLAFDVVSPCNISAAIGVSNPSENDVPMRPYTGVCYPNPSTTHIASPGSQRVALERYDIIDMSNPPADWRSWAMNPGYAGGSGRAGYPSLCATIVNLGTTPVTISNLQFYAEAISL